ncbi:MAG: helical backbone metal receptor [Cyclobacteriaceae bacterium]
MFLRTFADQLSNQITISFPPQRIISLVPSQTELLADLGLENSVVGITKFCIHPVSWLKTKTLVGGTKNLWLDVIESLQPDLIIGNKEENSQEDILKLQAKYPVWMSDIYTLQDALTMIHQLGKVTGTVEKSVYIQSEIRDAFSSISKLPPLRTLYLIWQKPWMGAATDTFIHELMTIAGLKNCLSEQKRYPELSEQDMAGLNPELILLSSEPYPFQEKHAMKLRQAFPTAIVLLVDGEMFSWYGSRVSRFPGYVKLLSNLIGA